MAPSSPSRFPPLWLQAIEEATACLRNGRRGGDYGISINSNGGNKNNTTRRTARGTEYVVPVVAASPSISSNGLQKGPQNACFFSHSPTFSFAEVLEASLEYLVLLESLLRKREANWDMPPNRKPPRRFHESSISPPSPTQQQQSEQQYRYNNHYPANVTPPNNNIQSSNRFAAFQTNDDDDESRSDQDDSMDDEAGDEPLLNINSIPVGTTIPLSAQDMSMRRLLIRVLTNQSEMFAAMANLFIHRSPTSSSSMSSMSYSMQPQCWTEGAQKLTYSLACIHEALMLADSEISRWLEAESTAADGTSTTTSSTDWQVQKSGLYQDADIVQVSIESLTIGRDVYLKEVKRLEAILMAKLQPQWKTRDEIKAKLGQRWFQNPAPKKDFARMREEAEAQLRDVQAALAHLEAIQTGDLTDSTERLRSRLNNTSSSSSSSSPWASAVSSSSTPLQQQQQRYNGQRPTDLSRRVDIVDYPDPTEFGWTFTGSSGTTEFFEKDGVKLDWYFTTGTVKTSMDHPTRGKTQLFGAKVDAQTYRQILQNPRHHTGQRYHQRRGGGGGGGQGGDDPQQQKQQRRRRRRRGGENM